MVLVIEHLVTRYDSGKGVDKVLAYLNEKGYSPVILSAKKSFLSILGPGVTPDGRETPPGRIGGVRPRGRQLTLGGDDGAPLGGDVFYTESSAGALFLLAYPPEAPEVDFVVEDTKGERRLVSPKPSDTGRIEIGFIGDSSGVNSLDSFQDAVSEAIHTLDGATDWTTLVPRDRRFRHLTEDSNVQFVSAQTISDKELESVRMLENAVRKEVCMTLKRAGGMLLADAVKSFPPEEAAASVVLELVTAGLIDQQYVVICRKTSNQVNRLASKGAVDHMAAAGILCACGQPIREERIEELLTPTALLKRFLDGSYWTSVLLVRELKALGIPTDRVILNRREGSEEVDAFVDLDGNLVMFELKDDQFSMGHAYAFGARIAEYRPEYAVIVAARGVAPEVKSHFGRVEPDSALVFVESLDGLGLKLNEIISDIRARRALEIFDSLRPMTRTESEFVQTMSRRVGLSASSMRRKGRPRRAWISM